MANIKNTNWHEKWKQFFVESVKDELELERLSYEGQPLTESKEIDSLVDKEFQKFEKLLKKNILDFKKKIKKHHNED